MTAAVSTTTTTPATTATTTTTARRRLTRLATVAGTAVVTTALFGLARATGADMTITDPGAGAVPHPFGAADIAMVTVVLGLVGWLTLAVLERFTRRATVIWTALGSVIVAISLPPIWIERATGETRFWLVVVHVAVGAVLIPLLPKARAGR